MKKLVPLEKPIRKTIQKAIVLQEHTLGILFPNGLQVLKASILRGSPYSPMNGAPFDCYLDEGKYRPATEKDFEDFGIAFHPEYLETIEMESTVKFVRAETN